MTRGNSLKVEPRLISALLLFQTLNFQRKILPRRDHECHAATASASNPARFTAHGAV
jgi:hypothetical protein